MTLHPPPAVLLLWLAKQPRPVAGAGAKVCSRRRWRVNVSPESLGERSGFGYNCLIPVGLLVTVYFGCAPDL